MIGSWCHCQCRDSWGCMFCVFMSVCVCVCVISVFRWIYIGFTFMILVHIFGILKTHVSDISWRVLWMYSFTLWKLNQLFQCCLIDLHGLYLLSHLNHYWLSMRAWKFWGFDHCVCTVLQSMIPGILIHCQALAPTEQYNQCFQSMNVGTL